MRQAQQRYPGDFWINYFFGCYWRDDYPQEAVGYLMLARALRGAGDREGALAAFRRSVDLNPIHDVMKERFEITSGRELEEARAEWEKSLERDPPEHDAWYGYAELCLFLGREEEYSRARRELLNRFGATTNSFVAERTSRACLLMPATGDELRQAAALAERA